MRALLPTILVLAISACAPTVPLDKYNSDLATANAELSMATAVILSFSANATEIAARLYTAEACVEAMPSTAEVDRETTPLASTSTPISAQSPGPATQNTPTPAEDPFTEWQLHLHSRIGFSIRIPPDWSIFESPLCSSGAQNCSASPRVQYIPPSPEPFVNYLDISIDPRPVDLVREACAARTSPECTETAIEVDGQPAFLFKTQGSEEAAIYVTRSGQTYLFQTQRYSLDEVKLALDSVRFNP